MDRTSLEMSVCEMSSASLRPALSRLDKGKRKERKMKKSIMVAAVSALCMSAAAVTITPTKVTINGSRNALFPHYEVSGGISDCGGLVVRVYDAARTTQYAEMVYSSPELATSGSHDVGLFLDGTGLNADDVEDGKPSIYIEMSVVDFCTITETGYQVLATSGIAYGDDKPGSGKGPATTRHYQKAQTLTSVVWTDDGVAVLSIKTGKINSKGVVSVSGSVMGMDGKKLSVKSVKLQADENERLHGTLQVKDGSTIDITIDEDEMWGTWNALSFNSGDDSVGGTFDSGRSLTFYFSGDTSKEAWPEGTVRDLLPQGEPVAVANGKWAFAKAATVKWGTPKNDILAPEVYDEASGKGLLVDTAKGKTNLSGLKLTYTPKTGAFKGSFKVYAVQSGKLKKYSAKVTGLVVNGTGFGMATVNGTSLSVEID